MELTRWKQLYAGLFGVSDVDEYLDSISYYNDDGGMAPQRYWMQLPELGHIIATLYNCICVSYSLSGGFTCLPCIVEYGMGPPSRTVVLGHIQQMSHFISVSNRLFVTLIICYIFAYILLLTTFFYSYCCSCKCQRPTIIRCLQ